MSQSIRFRLVSWLQRIIDHLSEDTVYVLSGCNVHSQTAGNLNNLIAVGVNNHAAKGQIENANVVTGFGKHVNEMNGASIVSNFGELISKSNRAPALNHYLVSHQNLSQKGNLYLSGQLDKGKAA